MDKKVLTKLEVETWLDMQISIYETQIREKNLTDSIYAIPDARGKRILINGAIEICKILEIVSSTVDRSDEVCKWDEITFYYNGYTFIEYKVKGMVS